MDLPPDIPEQALSWQFVRARGPGGQNVNKVATAAQLRLDTHATSLPEPTRQRLLKLAGQRASGDGVIVLHAERFRTQSRNRTDALERLLDLIATARKAPKKRVPTKPSRAAKARRRETKNQRSTVKQNRQKPRLD